MPQAVLALGVAATTVSGCVWYVPALVDLRAGADRPVSRRSAAAACLSGWSTTGFLAVLLLIAETWWIPAAVTGLGFVVTAGLRVRAAAHRRREARETAFHWAELDQRQTATEPVRTRKVVAVLIGGGLTVSAALAGLWVILGPGGRSDWVAPGAVSSAIVGLSLTGVVGHLRRARPTAAGRSGRPDGRGRPTRARGPRS